MFVVLLLACLPLSTLAEIEYAHLGRPCRVNHCDKDHVCVRRKDIDLEYRCVPKNYFKKQINSPEKITEWDLNPALMDEIVDATKCSSCLAEPLNYVCGTDGSIYRSPCYVKFFNCLFERDVQIACERECPCNATDEEVQNSTSTDFAELEDVNKDPLADESPDDPRGQFDVCSRAVHRELRNRFFDWFHQLEKLEQQIQYYDSMDNCNAIVLYMFHHFDVFNDSQLNDEELNGIEHLNNEICTDAFFARCDHDGDHRLFPSEWCDCFQNALLPCELYNNDLDTKFWNRSMEGIFRPHCTSVGYYAARQCNTETPRECWCVDKHGVEVDGSRRDTDHMPQCDELEDSRSEK